MEQDIPEAELQPPVFGFRPLSRREASRKLAEWFGDAFAPKPQTLARLAHEGRGPEYVRASGGKGRSGYFERPLWQWGVNRFRKAGDAGAPKAEHAVVSSDSS